MVSSPGSGGSTIASRVALFVCGVISNRQGFEYVELGPQRLPGSPSQYLDSCHSSGGLSHAFDSIEVEGATFIRYSQSRQICPNDSESNRGAYLSTGFLTANALSMHAAANCLRLVSNVYEHLISFIGPDSRFEKDFRLGDYSYRDGRIEDLVESDCSPLLLLDVLMQGLNAEGAAGWKPGQRIVFDHAAVRKDREPDRHLRYFNKGTSGTRLRLDREKERIQRLKQKLAVAASQIDQVHDEWLSYQSVMNEHLPGVVRRGTELRDLIEEIEQLNEATSSISVPNPKRPSSRVKAHRNSVPEASHSRIKRAGTAAHEGRFPSLSSRRSSGHTRRRRHEFGGGRRIAAVAAGLLIFVAGTIFAVQFMFGRPVSDGAVGAQSPPAEASEGQAVDPQRSAEVGAEHDDRVEGARSDVAEERAALGLSTTKD